MELIKHTLPPPPKKKKKHRVLTKMKVNLSQHLKLGNLSPVVWFNDSSDLKYVNVLFTITDILIHSSIL